jgi:hypothetical protein
MVRRKFAHLRRPLIAVAVAGLLAASALFGTHGTTHAAGHGAKASPPSSSAPLPGGVSPTSITWD